ncbi:hypothetical protein GCM10027199_10150 [Amycolatopsis magusensis]
MVGGYTFDADAMAARIRELEALRDRIRDQSHVLRRAMEAVQPPADDDAAKGQAKATALSIEAAVRHNRAMDDYATSYLAVLQAASGAYVNKDVSTGVVFEK